MDVFIVYYKQLTKLSEWTEVNSKNLRVISDNLTSSISLRLEKFQDFFFFVIIWMFLNDIRYKFGATVLLQIHLGANHTPPWQVMMDKYLVIATRTTLILTKSTIPFCRDAAQNFCFPVTNVCMYLTITLTIMPQMSKVQNITFRPSSNAA